LAGPPGPKGDPGAAAPKLSFNLHKFVSAAGKAVTGQCEAGEQLIAVTCSTSASIADDAMSATCTAPVDAQATAQMTLTCAK
jgi:hypothetical protein